MALGNQWEPVHADHEYNLEIKIHIRSSGKQKDPGKGSVRKAVCPRFTKPVDETWWVVLGEVDKGLLIVSQSHNLSLSLSLSISLGLVLFLSIFLSLSLFFFPFLSGSLSLGLILFQYFPSFSLTHSSSSGELIAMKRLSAPRSNTISTSIAFYTPEFRGRHIYTLYIISQTYLGLGKIYTSIRCSLPFPSQIFIP